METNQYMSVFVDESREHLQSLNDNLLKLEQEPENMSIIEEIFRSAHTLKGMAATMGFDNTAELTHDLENVLDEVRNHNLKITTEIVDLLFDCLDTLNILTDEIIEEGGEKTGIDNLANQLSDILEGDFNSEEPEKNPKKEKVPQNVTDMNFNEYEKQIFKEAKSKGLNTYLLKVTLEESCLLKAARVYMVFRNLEELGEIIKSIPDTESLEEEEFDLSFEIAFVTKEEMEKVKKSTESVSEIENVEIMELDISENNNEEEESEVEDNIENDAGTSKTPKKKKERKIKHRKSTTVRVDTDKLDSLMNLVAELVINKTRLFQLNSEYNLEELTETLAHVDRVTGDLQNIVTKVRMVPIETVFNRFPRMVRDLAKELNKEINLVIEGQDTELDRTVIDEIGDPLVHLLRNSLDHGIEHPEEREKAGKDREGTILLKAEHEGNNVIITIEDDGAGIDSDNIAKSAIKKGIKTEEEIKKMDEQDILQLIFASGFSTAEKVSDVSGRGVGMDVVKTKIEGINGEIALNTELGRGTEIKIKLPLTLAIIEALLINLKEEIFAIPLANIVETVDITKDDVKVVQGEKVIMLRGEVVSVVNLGKTLEVPEYQLEDKQTTTLVIVKAGKKKLGLIVDHLIGQQEIVIKPLGKVFSDLKGITGATVLGNGEVALILDVLTLIK
ncbi:MAG: chemotaxis protein CheA [Fusobacteriota bacterium]